MPTRLVSIAVEAMRRAQQLARPFVELVAAPPLAFARTQGNSAPPASAPPLPPGPPLPPERWEPDPGRRPDRDPEVDTDGFAAAYFASMLALFLAVCATVPVGAALVSAFGWPGMLGAAALGGLAVVTLLQR